MNVIVKKAANYIIRNSSKPNLTSRLNKRIIVSSTLPCSSLSTVGNQYSNTNAPYNFTLNYQICKESGLNIEIIDPLHMKLPKEYETPAKDSILNLYFDLPMLNIEPKTDPNTNNNKIETPGIIKPIKKCSPHTVLEWRRKKMLKHRRKKRHKREATERKKRAILAEKLKQHRLNENLKKIWESAELKTPPPELSEEQKHQYEKSWKEKGLWSNALSEEELYEYNRGPPVKHLRPFITDDSVWALWKEELKGKYAIKSPPQNKK